MKKITSEEMKSMAFLGEVSAKMIEGEPEDRLNVPQKALGSLAAYCAIAIQTLNERIEYLEKIIGGKDDDA